MIIKSIGDVMEVLEAAYPKHYQGQNDEQRAKTIKLWAVMFVDDELAVVGAAVKAFIVTDSKGFPPSIGQIKNKMADLVRGDEMSEYEAWNLVKEAIRDGGDGYYNFTTNCYSHEAAFAKLPPVLQRLVGSPNVLREWYNMKESTVESVVGSNFMRSYRARTASSREYDMLPGDVKNIAGALAHKIAMPELPAPMGEHELNERRNAIARELELAEVARKLQWAEGEIASAGGNSELSAIAAQVSELLESTRAKA